MSARLDAKKTGKDIKLGSDEVLEIWTCGCTAVGSVTPVDIKCVKCENSFKKVAQKSPSSIHKKSKNDSGRFELVNNIQSLYSEGVDVPFCKKCGDLGQVKIYTQEWDRIKSHMSPCSECHPQEWLVWLEGKRIVENI